MFRDVPGCSGMFHVSGFIDGPGVLIKMQRVSNESGVLEVKCKRK